MTKWNNEAQIGYCGWCFHHTMSWKDGPRDERTITIPHEPRWRLTCNLDDEEIFSYSTCSAWRHILMSRNGVFTAQVDNSAHEKAELLRAKTATFQRYIHPRAGGPS